MRSLMHGSLFVITRCTTTLLHILVLASGILLGNISYAAQGGEEVILRKTYSGNVDYVANGASFRTTPNGSGACNFVAAPMSSTINIDIPIGANILDAYLYFAGSANGSIDLSTQSLTLNGVALNVSAGFNDIDYDELEDVVLAGIDFFGARRDVSSIVTGPGAYTFAGLEVAQDAFRAGNETCLGAWALVVIYEDPNITQIRVVNLFDGFQFYQNDTFDLQPRNFVVDNLNPAGKMTHISFEGDATLGTAGENFLFSDDNITFTELINGINPLNNQYNDTVSGPNVFDRNDEYGLDVDTYAIDSLLTPGAFEAVTRYNTGQDLVLLMSEVIQVDNLPLADLEVTLSDVGTFQTNTDDAAQFVIEVQNNGDGIPGSLTAFAEGNVFVYFDLEAGIDIDNLGDITAPGWNCNATNFVTNDVRCYYDLSTLAGGNLDAGQSLPDITLTVDVATPASPISSVVHMTNCEAAQGTSFPDNCVTFAGKHQFVDQFDPVNFFEEDEVNIFFVQSKSDINNNVDREITPIITGTPSDLSTSTKMVTAPSPLDPGDTLTYVITLTESAGVAANNITVTDVIDPDTTGFSLPALTNNCGGSATFVFGVLEVDGFNLPANSSCTIEFDLTVPVTATPGTSIDNSANIVSTNGVGANVAAQTLLVAGAATGSKPLYFESLVGTGGVISRDAPNSNDTITLLSGQTANLILTPSVAANLDINAGLIPVSVWVEATADANDYGLTVDLNLPGTTAGSVSNVTMNAIDLGDPDLDTLQEVAQLYPLQIDLGANTTVLNGNSMTLSITNDGSQSIRIHSLINSIESKLILDAETVINVDDIRFYTDAGLTNELVGDIDAGSTIYIEATVSDPFGHADITGATLTLIDPNLANQLTNVAMNEEPGAAGAIKRYSLQYDIPDAASIPVGPWVAQVTAIEGQEGTVTHTEADSFTTTTPEITVTYSVDNLAAGKTLTASPGETLVYTIEINNAGASTPITINQAIPGLTQNLNSFAGFPFGTVNNSNASNIDLSFNAPSGITTITFRVDVVGGALPGQLIDHTISLSNLVPPATDIAPSVLIDPFNFNTGNKPIYGDAFNTVRRFDRTEPTTNTSTNISSQGGSRTFTLSPVLQSQLTLNGDINASIWASRDASFAGQRIIEATLAYAGAANGTIGTDTVTIQLADSSPQYIPFTFSLGSPLILPANTSLTLTITNDTTVAGETITVSSFLSGDSPSNVATLISLNATDPLTITNIEFFSDSVDTVNPGTPLTISGASETVWVRATVSDPFGRDDITDALLRIEDPNDSQTLALTSMNVPVAQPASLAEKYFELSHALSTELGEWEAFVTAEEGQEGIVQTTSSATLDVDNVVEDISGSYKIVQNVTTGDLGATNENDVLRYTIELVESGGTNAVNVDVTDNIPANTTFVPNSLTLDGVVQADPAGTTISLTGLTVPATGTLTIEFDVTIDPGTAISTVISNTATIDHPNGTPNNFDVSAEDVIVTGIASSGIKALYFENLNTTPILTRNQPATADLVDTLTIGAGASQTLSISPALAGPITIDPADGSIPVVLRTNSASGGFSFGNVTVSLDYQVGAAVTNIGTVTQFAFLGFGGNAINTNTYNIPVSAIANIPAGATMRVTIQNAMSQGKNIFSFDSAANRSAVSFDPDPVINIDEISFWTDINGAGTEVTNPNPDGTDVDIYARVVVSDPFGDFDIQAPETTPNPSTISISDPGGNATYEGTNLICTAPCYAYAGEDVGNDPPGDATRTFYYLIRIAADSGSNPRGTWTVQFTANEGLEVGQVSNVRANGFTTLSQPNLSTSAKTFTNTGDVDPGDVLTYEITINNSGGQDATGVIFSDTLQGAGVVLTFQSASTTCVDSDDNPQPNPSHAAQVVSLSGIKVPGSDSCVITINATVGPGTPGDQINNTANITNPQGPSANPMAPTILLSESQIPVSGAKQLYLEGLGAGRTLTRAEPNAGSSEFLAGAGGTTTLTLFQATTRAMTLEAGNIPLNLVLNNDGNGGFFGQARLIDAQLSIDANDGNPATVLSSQVNLTLSTTPGLSTIVVNNPSNIVLNPGSDIQLQLTNSTAQGDRGLTVNQVATAPYSEAVLPIQGAIEVTELRFFDRSATDDSAGPAGCATTFSCGTELLDDPLFIVATGSVWIRTSAADGFGAADVNTGSQVCDGVTQDNCPTITVTNPNAGSTTTDLMFLNEPDTSTRQYEFEVVPAGLFLDGTWQVEVEFSEGVEGLILDTSVNTFERYSPAVLTVVKSVSGDTDPGSILTYDNNVTNTADGPAINVSLTNLRGDFSAIELVDNGGTWTALFSLSGGYTVSAETFDDGDDSFTYDPNSEGVCFGQPSPCYDPAIIEWRIELNENVPGGTNFIQQYRARIE